MNFTRRFRVVLGLLLSLVALVPLRSLASTFEIFACAPLTSECQTVPLSDPTGPLSDSALYTPAPGVLAQAGIGGNLGHVSGSTLVNIAVGNVSGFLEYVEGAYAQAGSRWLDTWTVTAAPALTGTPGTLFASVVVDADAIVTIDTLPAGALGACAEAGWNLLLSGGDAGVTLLNAVGGAGLCEDGGGLNSQNYGSDGTFSFSVPIVFGAEHGWDLQWRATSSVYGWVDGGGGLTGSADLQFVNTVQWLGISMVHDANGNPVDFDMAADSAVDWTSPVPLQVVPLPASIWLLGTALAGVATRRRHRGGRSLSCRA
jgi:hypothetical protein